MRQCPNPECPDVVLNDRAGEFTDTIRTCPYCDSILVEDREPESASLADDSADSELVELCSPQTAGELAVVKTLLQAEKIAFFVHNEFFGALKVGPSIPLFNQRTVMVAARDLDVARGALTLPADAPRDENEALPSSRAFRNLIEVLLFGWIIPARRSSSVFRGRNAP